MKHYPRSFSVVLALALLAGCGDSSGVAGGGAAAEMGVSDAAPTRVDGAGDDDAGGADGATADAAPDDAAVPGDAGPRPDGAVELPDDTVVLEMDPMGMESGRVVTGDDAAARFYSAARGAYWEISLVDPEGEGMGAGTEVTVAVDAEGNGHYFIYDPTERYAPIVLTAATPEMGEHTLEVDAADQVFGDESTVEFVPDPPNPFAFTVISLNVSISIQGVMREMAWSAVFAVLGSLLSNACNAIVPVYDDICGIAGAVVGVLGGVVRPGFALLRAEFATGGAAFIALGRGLIGKLGDWGCGQGGKMLSKAFAEEDVGTLRDTFRLAVTKYHYLLWALEENPPADPADAQELTTLLETIGPQLSVMAPQIRRGYVTIFSATGSPATKEPLYGQVIDRTKDIISAAQRVNWDPVITDLLERRLFGPLPTGGVVWVDVPVGKVTISEQRLSALQPSLAGINLADCAIAVWQGFEGSYTQNNAMVNTERTMPQVYETASRAAMAALDEIYGRLYGGEIPIECLVDEYEPNDDWRQAVAAPAGFAVGRDPIRLRDLSLCNVGDGTAREHDWYAFPMGRIAFDATARLRPPEGMMMGHGQPVCMEMYYYGEVSELAGTPPTALGGQCSGAGGWFFDVGPIGLRRAAGESWAFLLVHVYGAAESDGPVTYDLSFAL